MAKGDWDGIPNPKSGTPLYTKWRHMLLRGHYINGKPELAALILEMGVLAGDWLQFVGS